jgi:hypothetical protein
LQNTARYKDTRLTCEIRNDKRYNRIVNPKQQHGHQDYRGDFFKNKEVQKTAAHQYFLRARTQVANMLKLLEHLNKEAKNIDPNFYPESLSTSYQLQPPFVCDQVGVINIKDWKNTPRRCSTKKPEDKIHRTRDGWMVRSKSEVMYADGYSEANIPYLYEVLRMVCGKWLAPDFLALCVRRYQEIIHEHNGKMDDPDYVTRSFIPRLGLYLADGYIPGVNLIFTGKPPESPCF